MHIGRTRRFLIVAIVLFVETKAHSSAHADYIVKLAPYGNIRRIMDSGTTSRVYVPPPGSLYEFDAQDYAVTPDFSTIYDFPFAQGFSDLVYAFDATTGQPLLDKYLNPDSTINPDQNFIYRPRQALIWPNALLPAGDLCVISGADQSRLDAASTNDVIKRFTRSPSNPLGNPHIETILPPFRENIYDFAFGPESDLYISTPSGVFRYSPNSTSPQPFPQSQNWQTILPGTSGMIAFDPDGRLHVRNSVTGNIDRYTTTGDLIDTFVSNALVSGSQSIQFGVDGNLHVNTILPGGGFPPIAAIAKFDGVSGALLSMTPLAGYFSAVGRITYVPVPEPSSVPLLLAPCIFWRRRARVC